MNAFYQSENLTNMDHKSIMSELVSRHEEALLPLLLGRNIHYLDLPFHDNLGDSLIMHGTLRFFARHNLTVSQYGMYFNYSPKWADKEDVIVFHGGGNFGDLYGVFQAFRERVIAALPENRIILLPQSIHFENPANFEKCREIFSRHQDLHICVRDRESERLARKITQNVYLLPDMAHQLWPLERTSTPRKEVLHLCRRDGEARADRMFAKDSFDWIDIVGKKRQRIMQIAERNLWRLHRLGIHPPMANMLAQWWIKQSLGYVSDAVALFSGYERIESDRLHAHILSSLLGMPNRITDNSYGKNSRYISLWTGKSPLVTLDSMKDSA